MKTILITGGAGYIGSHTCLSLLSAGYNIVVLDNFSNSNPESLERVSSLSGRDFQSYTCNILDTDKVKGIMVRHDVNAVIHFAGLKAVGESVEKPLQYYHNNVVGSHALLCAMKMANVKQIVFSSSATVYGTPQKLPLTEDHPLSATNPYGRSKLIVEDMLRDLYRSDNDWRISILRYFNPCGAHDSGQIGEDPTGTPNNLMPFIAQVASGLRDEVSIWGGDYQTPDGTGVRDYIHVVDLADGHLKALESLEHGCGCVEVNLGTGNGYSVREMIAAFSAASKLDIKYSIKARRSGDVATCFADPEFAYTHLGWRAKRNLVDMCGDHWNWQRNNPNGYEKQSLF
ncbi:UDP-glucose 4-epimerase GalE [bacterium AH-315-J23]|nr:UDP-glucose 4-epimerase GalE [bacterium AH-315-J23]